MQQATAQYDGSSEVLRPRAQLVYRSETKITETVDGVVANLKARVRPLGIREMTVYDESGEDTWHP